MESLGKEITPTMFLFNSLESNHFCIIDNFLDQKLASSVSRATKYFYSTFPDMFSFSANGSKFRDDVTCWIKDCEEKCTPFLLLNIKLFDLMKSLVEEYNNTDTTLKLSHKSKLQISCFPNGSHGYKPHIDNPNGNGRILTLVYFPNESYDRETYEGVSRFYVRNKSQCINVEPISNRLIVYWSDRRVMSETLPSSKNVFSISCWYFGEQLKNELKK